MKRSARSCCTRRSTAGIQRLWADSRPRASISRSAARRRRRRDDDPEDRELRLRLRAAALLSAALAASAPHAAAAEAYPAKPVRFVAAFPPRGRTDVIARPFAAT